MFELFLVNTYQFIRYLILFKKLTNVIEYILIMFALFSNMDTLEIIIFFIISIIIYQFLLQFYYSNNYKSAVVKLTLFYLIAPSYLVSTYHTQRTLRSWSGSRQLNVRFPSPSYIYSTIPNKRFTHLCLFYI